MKIFIASIEERYVWDCPYCGHCCGSDCDDPEEQESVICERCGKESKCEYTDR